MVCICCQPAYKNNRKTQTLMSHDSKTVKIDIPCKKCLNFDVCSETVVNFFSLKQKVLPFFICLQKLRSAILHPGWNTEKVNGALDYLLLSFYLISEQVCYAVEVRGWGAYRFLFGQL